MWNQGFADVLEPLIIHIYKTTQVQYRVFIHPRVVIVQNDKITLTFDEFRSPVSRELSCVWCSQSTKFSGNDTYYNVSESCIDVSGTHGVITIQYSGAMEMSLCASASTEALKNIVLLLNVQWRPHNRHVVDTTTRSVNEFGL